MKTTRHSKRSAFVAVAVLSFACLPALAQDYRVLHQFTGGTRDGAKPYGLLIQSRSTLYGTSLQGGGSNNLGVIFALDIAPKLAITPSDTNVNLSWSTNFPDFALEGTDQLTGAWTFVPGVTGYSATLPMNADSQFFRLRRAIAITYIANEGFLLCGGGKKVLIDAIFTEGWSLFQTPSSEVLTQERNATAPFNNIDALLVTHNHADHINPTYVFQHMTNDPAAILIGPAQVYSAITEIKHYRSVIHTMTHLPPVYLMDTPMTTLRFPAGESP